MLYRYNSIFVQFIKYLTILPVDSASNFSFKKKILICVRCGVSKYKYSLGKNSWKLYNQAED